jgi:hypothetical protein
MPHTPTGTPAWEGSRGYHLARHLCRVHELHWITWRQSTRLRDVGHWGTWSAAQNSLGTAYTVWLAPNLYRLVTRRYPRSWHVALNQRLFRRAIGRISRDVMPDVVVCSPSHYCTGFPRFDPETPVLLDYVDHNPDWVEATYVHAAHHAIVVSERLAKSVEKYQKAITLIPNGVDSQRYLTLDRELAKAKLGLTGAPVISLIGLTCCPSLYFVEAVASIQRAHPSLQLLIVGGGKMREAIVRKAREQGVKSLHAPGHVSHEEVPWYFAATEVGLYPGADTTYYRHASPLKIVEYTAAGAQVVTSPVDMHRLGWPNVWMVEATSTAFEQAILAALQAPKAPADVAALDWRHLAGQFDGVLRELAPLRRGSRHPAALEARPGSPGPL